MIYNYYEDDSSNKKKIIKKIAIITITFIIIFLLVRACTNAISSRIREDIKNDETTRIDYEQNEKMDLSKPFSYYNITSDNELHELIRKISQYLQPSKLQKYVDYDLYSLKYFDWNKINDMNEILENMPSGTYSYLLELLLYNKVNYDEAPLTEHFKEKFNENKGILYDYGLKINNQAFNLVEYDYDKKYFAVETNRGSEINEYIDKLYIFSQDYHYFNFILDEEGYLDDIEFDHIKHITDENGEEIPIIDQYKLDDKEYVERIIKWLCIPQKYGSRTALTDDWYHAYDKDLNYALTDKFREFSKNLRPNGILQYEDFVNFKIESIDVENKIALVKVELEDKYVYYDITWTLVDDFKMDAVKAILNHEEKKL